MQRRQLGGVRVLAGLLAVTVSAPAIASTITQNTSWTIDRAGTSTKYRVVAYGDSIYAGYRGSIFERREARRALGRRRVRVADVERRHRGRSGAPSRARSPPTSTTTRSSPSARTCRRRTRASSPSRCAATTACRRAAASRARAAPATTAPLDTALANCTNYQQLAMQAINQYATTATREDRLEPLLPGLRRRQRADAAATIRRPGRRSTSRASSCPTSPRCNWRACNFANAVRLPVRRQLRAVHGRGLRLERRRPDRLRRAALRAGRVGERLRDAHHA